jgi:hypothetical protein
MTRITNARPLSEIVNDIQYGDKKVSKKLAEEAVKSVAADGKIDASEVDRLEGYANGTYDSNKQRAEDADGWKHGTETGRALMNGLASTIQELSESKAAKEGKDSGVDLLSLWTGGWMQSGPAKSDVQIDEQALMAKVRQSSVGWVHNSVETLLRSYPKATDEIHTQMLVPKPEVQAAIDELTKKWVAGDVQDLPKISDALKPLLDAKYR